MAQDYFAILGLTPGRYSPREITTRFLARRKSVLAELGDPTRHTESRRDLEELHMAYSTLRDPWSQAAYLESEAGQCDPVATLRTLIAASLEDGLLRHSRRQTIVGRARQLGLSAFQAHMLIAQVQFGGREADPARNREIVMAKPAGRRTASRLAARCLGVWLLALTMFLVLVRVLRP